MIPYNPFDAHVLWFNAWRGHIKTMKIIPDQATGYGRAAAIAQACYVMELALKIGRLKKAGLIQDE